MDDIHMAERSGQHVNKLDYAFVFVAGTILLVGVSLLINFAYGTAEVPVERLAATETIQPAAPTPAATDEAVLVFVGDVMLARGVAQSVEKNKREYAFLYEKTASFLNEADVAFCNLLCALSKQGEPVKKNYTYRATPTAAAALARAGFDVVSLANSHILDYGPAAANDTVEHLSAASIKSMGLLADGQPQVPALFEVKGIRIGYLAYADPRPKYAYPKIFRPFPTRPARGDIETIRQDIARLKPAADLVVVSMHWGVEYAPKPNVEQQELGRAIIDAGAHVVVGHHPHVQQEPEAYKNGLILYSLGSFIADLHTRPETLVSRLYRVIVTKSGLRHAEYLPLTILYPKCQPVPTSADFVSVPLRTASPES